ncbi:NAD-dependent epimerase/dehydratase family protein [Ferrovum myxofaciens]|uniref:NAD-dependent epimerase/dehydratase family protein n=1 Tax=Ferrovum myxofaciens TaxID=416213 RepID=UPI003EBE8C2C
MEYPLLVVTGSNGFIGRHFIKKIHSTGIRIRALTRNKQHADTDLSTIEWVVGDINDHTTWKKLLEPDCIVVNLAYSNVTALDDALNTSRIMAQEFSKSRIRRLVHCSTLSVYGFTACGTINELTPCKPINAYGTAKLEIDNIFLESKNSGYDIAILRPSSVFGIGGQTLHSLCNTLTNRSHVLNYVRSSLFGYRRMHLVPVETVVAALQFLCESHQTFDQEIFIISEDDDSKNNFRDVEKILMTSLGVSDYPIPPITMPSALLKGLLSAKGSAEIDPSCYYSSSKLKNCGFVAPINLSTALRSFAEHYRQIHIPKPAVQEYR